MICIFSAKCHFMVVETFHEMISEDGDSDDDDEEINEGVGDGGKEM